MLFLVLATFYCNDIYHEAAKRNIKVKKVEVSGDFGTKGEPAKNVTYRAKAHAKGIRALMKHTDTIAEIQNTVTKNQKTSEVSETSEVRKIYLA